MQKRLFSEIIFIKIAYQIVPRAKWQQAKPGLSFNCCRVKTGLILKLRADSDTYITYISRVYYVYVTWISRYINMIKTRYIYN